MNYVISKVNQLEFLNLLDVGCGDGKLIYELYNKMPPKTFVGIDISEKAILFGKAMTPKAEFVFGSIMDEELKIGQFDIVTLIETLEHIPLNEIKNFVSALHKHTKNYLIVTVPSKNQPLAPKHFQHFDLLTLKNTLEPYFTITEHKYLQKQTISTRIIKRLLANRFFALNHKPTLNKLLRYYLKNSFFGDSKNTNQIFVLAKPNNLEDFESKKPDNS